MMTNSSGGPYGYRSSLRFFPQIAISDHRSLRSHVPPPSVAQGSTGRDDAIAQATRLAIQTTGTAKKIPSAACLRALSRGKKVPKNCPHGGNSSGIAKGDFNGDGFADLAIGMPSKDESRTIKNSGAVAVIYGSANGLTAPATAGAVPLAQVWTQNSPGVPGDSESNDFFSATLASGDFNGDNFSDLAIGAPSSVRALIGCSG